MALASTTTTGIELRWWLERLMQVQEEKGCTKGPVFGSKTAEVALMLEYVAVLHFFLRKKQSKYPQLIDPADKVEAPCSFFRSFRRTAEGKKDQGSGV